uniref:Uncharacterized protein n=1 Tax=Davidia involucrata TaxID=16924 RepID=A0A5B7BF08_DAVIN
MDSVLTIGSSHSHFKTPSVLTSLKPSLKPTLSLIPSNIPFPFSKHSNNAHHTRTRVRASSNSTPNGSPKNPIFQNLKTTASAILLAAVATSCVIGKFHQQLPVRAESLPTLTEECIGTEVENQQEQAKDSSPPVVLSVDALRSLLLEKLKMGEDEEALKILKELVSAQPEEIEWRFLMVKLLNEMGKFQEARNVFEEILKLLDRNNEAKEQFSE